MKLILHCGEPKTGSTSIQKYLYKHRRALSRRGILYNARRVQKNHNPLMYLVGRIDQMHADGRSGVLDEAFTIVREVQQASLKGTHEYLLLSAELFAALRHHEMKQLLDSLNVAFDAIFCILYLRNPMEFYLSLAQEKAKYGALIEHPCTFQRDPCAMAEKWSAFAGPERLYLGAFDRQQLAEGNIVQDFKQKLEAITGCNVLPHGNVTSNVSLTAEQTTLLYEYRKDFHDSAQATATLDTLNLTRFFGKLNAAEALQGTPCALRESYRHTLCERHEESLKRLQEKFGIAFSTDAKSPGQEEGAPQYTPLHHVQELLQPCNEEVYSLLKGCMRRYNPRQWRNTAHLFCKHPLTRWNASFAWILVTYQLLDLGRRLLEAVADQSKLYRMAGAVSRTPRNNRNADYWYAQGLMLWRQNDLHSAQKMCEKALELAPQNPHPYMLLSRIHFRRSRFEDALQNVRRAIELDAQNPEFQTQLARIQCKREDYKAAKQACMQALQLDETFSDAWCFLSETYEKRGRLDKAENSIRRALAINGKVGRYHMRLGQVLLAQGRTDAARSALGHAVSLDSALVAAYLQLARLFEERDELQEAIALLQLAVAEKAKNPRLWFRLGELQQQAGDSAGAEESLARAVELKPSNPLFLQRLGELLLEKGELQTARRHLENALQQAPRNKKLKNLLQQASSAQEGEDLQ